MDTLRGLNHPKIVQLMGLCTETGDIYIVTEFIPGGNLRQTLKNHELELSWERRIGFAKDIALAMTYLHHKGIMHRDLKSANLLISNDWKLKVCDFGLARNSPVEGEKYITTVGTNEWMAPEVALQDPYGQSADVFSYGMVLYEIINRKKPPVRRMANGYAFDTSLKAEIPADTPPGLWELLVECASQDPDSRPTFPDIVKRLKDIGPTDQGSLPQNNSKRVSTAKKPLPARPSTVTASESPEPPRREKNGHPDDDHHHGHDDDESSEEEHMSYIDRGREIAEVSKILKKPFRRSMFCKIECSIQKKASWAPGSEVSVKVKIENQSGKVVKTCQTYLKPEGGAKKGKAPKGKISTFKEGKGFPVKHGCTWEGNIPFVLPMPDEGGERQEVAMEFTLTGGFASKKACAYIPIVIEKD